MRRVSWTVPLLLFASLALPAAARAADAPSPTARGAAAVVADSAAAERDSLAALELEWIRGRENEPADSVFKNIQILKGIPAGRLLGIMSQGWGRALGVRCSHCHIVGHYRADDKAPKQIARDMVGMVSTIDTELLPKIKNLKSEKPMVNCTTCHRGQVKPALNLE
jgi:Photosynthetic reaction centre cytochrome C subunit